MPDYKVWKELEPSPAPGIQCYHCSESDHAYPWYLHEFEGKNVHLRMYELRAGAYRYVFHLLATWDEKKRVFNASSLPMVWHADKAYHTPTMVTLENTINLHTCYRDERLYFSRNKRTLKAFVTKELA